MAKLKKTKVLGMIEADRKRRSARHAGQKGQTKVASSSTRDSEDSGTGVEENIAGRLFEPFVTSKEPGQGTGLGLWVVFNLVKKMGAEIAIASPAENSDCGTTVTLCFPLSSSS